MLQARGSRLEHGGEFRGPTPRPELTVLASEKSAALLAASRNGQFEALFSLLDPDVVLRELDLEILTD